MRKRKKRKKVFTYKRKQLVEIITQLVSPAQHLYLTTLYSSLQKQVSSLAFRQLNILSVSVIVLFY